MGSVDEPGLLVQEEVDQRRQTEQAVGSRGPTGDLLVISGLGRAGLVWLGWSGLNKRKEERSHHLIIGDE